jgi:hypothetical protein
MTSKTPYAVALFSSTSHALMAEKIAKKEGIPCKLIPVPRQLSSDCGICLRFNAEDRTILEASLQNRVDWMDIHPLSSP